MRLNVTLVWGLSPQTSDYKNIPRKNSNRPIIAKGTPMIAPLIVKLTMTPTSIRTAPSTIATKRPVISTMTASSFQMAAKGHKYQGIDCF